MKVENWAELVSIILAMCFVFMIAPLPFWMFWTWQGLGEIYGAGLPEYWRSIPYSHCIGLYVCASMIVGIFRSPIKSS